MSLPGLELEALAEYLGPDYGPPEAWRAALIAGGRSNLTYLVGNGDRRWVLRRPPLGHVLATAHDMGRECRVLAALESTDVPVPRLLVYCASADVLGAPFYLMSHVPGVAYRRAAELAPLGAARTAAVSAAMIETLARLHAVDPAGVGLSDFGRPAGFTARQVRRWQAQLAASRSRELPDAEKLYEWLTRHDPPEQEPALIHGDFRLDNLLVDVDDRIAAVIDWEMATLGDPLTDLALLLAYRRLSELAPDSELGDVWAAPGFLPADELVDRYARASGRDLSHLPFYRALAAFKLAAILEGISYRHLQGETVGAGFERLGALVEPLLADAVSEFVQA